MGWVRSNGSNPLLLTIWADGTVVGIAPLMTRRKFGIRYATFLPFCSFAACGAWMETCVSEMLDFLLARQHCQFIALTAPAASPYIATIKKECARKRIHLSQSEGAGQSVLTLNSNWHDFAKSRGKKFLQDIRRAERNLNRAGSWGILRLEQPDQASEAYEHIMRVEKTSWKQSYRNQTGSVDVLLLSIMAGLRSSTQATPKWCVWFLEVNDQVVAYVLFLHHRQIAYPVKTSFDQRYARFGPGIYLMNAAIRSLFEKEKACKIDFISDVPFTSTWTSEHPKRIRLTIAPDPILPRTATVLLRGYGFARDLRLTRSHWILKRVYDIVYDLVDL